MSNEVPQVEEFIEGMRKTNETQEFARVTKVNKGKKLPPDVERKLLIAAAPIIGQFRKTLKDNIQISIPAKQPPQET